MGHATFRSVATPSYKSATSIVRVVGVGESELEQAAIPRQTIRSSRHCMKLLDPMMNPHFRHINL